SPCPGPVCFAVGWRANQQPNTASSPAATSSAPPGFTSTATSPTSAGPSTNDASSAAPSYEKAASTSLGCAAPSALVIGRQRTLASGPTCGIASPAATEAATVAGSPAPALTNATKVVSPAAATRDWTRTTGRCPI